MPSVTMPEGEYLNLMERAKAGGLALVKEGPTSHKSLLMTVMATAGGFWLLQSDAVKKIKVFAENYFLRGLLILVAGYWLWKKRNPWWGIVVGLGATTLAMDFKAHQEKTEAAGVDEAGDVYDWQAGPDGRPAFGPKQRNDLADQMAGRVFRTA